MYDGEVKEAVDGLTGAFTEFKERSDARIAEIASAVAKLDAKMGRPRTGGGDQRQGEQSAEFKAFTTLIRQGKEALTAEEFKALRVADDTAGGYLSPPEVVAELIKNVVPYSPVRQAARIGVTSLGSVKIPKRTGQMTGVWVSETETRTSTQPTYGQVEITVNECACYVDISNQLLEDSAVDIANELALDFAEEFGRLEGAAFVTGTGVKQPIGFMTDSSVPSVASGAATTVTADSIFDLYYTLKPFYRGRAAWMMNGKTTAAVRKLKDGDGNYLWRAGLEQGQPPTLLGQPVVEAVDMPDQGAGLYPIAFGDFSSAYRIYDRVQLALLRDPFTVATSGLVRFHGRRRVGGAVVKAEALVKLKCSVS